MTTKLGGKLGLPAMDALHGEPPLEWRAGNTSWYIVSACARYGVSKATLGKDTRYTAWRLRPNAPGQMLGMHASAEEAKAHAQRDARFADERSRGQ